MCENYVYATPTIDYNFIRFTLTFCIYVEDTSVFNFHMSSNVDIERILLITLVPLVYS